MPLLPYIASVRVLYQRKRKQSWDNDTYFRDVFIYFILNMLIHNELFCVAYDYCSICLSVFHYFFCTLSLSRYISLPSAIQEYLNLDLVPAFQISSSILYSQWA